MRRLGGLHGLDVFEKGGDFCFFYFFIFFFQGKLKIDFGR